LENGLGLRRTAKRENSRQQNQQEARKHGTSKWIVAQRRLRNTANYRADSNLVFRHSPKIAQEKGTCQYKWLYFADFCGQELTSRNVFKAAKRSLVVLCLLLSAIDRKGPTVGVSDTNHLICPLDSSFNSRLQAGLWWAPPAIGRDPPGYAISRRARL
jgi:hypothetical protein